MRNSIETAGRSRIVLCYLLFGLFHVVSATYVAYSVPFPGPIDEHIHFSYAHYLHRHPDMLTGNNVIPLIETDYYERYGVTTAPELTAEGRRKSLPHLPYYYHFLRWFSPPDYADIHVEARRLRLINVILSSIGIGLMLIAGYVHLSSPLQHLVYAAGITVCAKLGVVSGYINNDNLVTLGAGLAALGLFRLRIARCVTIATAALVGLGFLVCAVGKFTAGFLLGLVIFMCHWPLRRMLTEQPARAWPYLAVLATLTIVGLLPYLQTLIVTGTLVREDASDFLTAESAQVRVSALQFVVLAVYLFFAKWAIITTGTNDIIDMVTLYTALSLSLWGWLRSRRAERQIDGPGGIGALLENSYLAILAMMLIHGFFMYQKHLETGYLGGIRFRYYLPLWPVIVAGMAVGIDSCRNARVRLGMAGLIVVLLIYSYVPLAIFRRLTSGEGL